MLIEIEVPADGEPRVVAQALREALARGEPFAAVVSMPVMARPRRLAGAAERIRMLKELRPGLAARCRGLAFVMPMAAQQDNAKAIRSADKIWACPTTTTDDLEQARAWARDRLAS